MDRFQAEQKVADLEKKLSGLCRYTVVRVFVDDIRGGFPKTDMEPIPHCKVTEAALKKEISELNALIPFTTEYEIAQLRKRIADLPRYFIDWEYTDSGVLTARGESPNPRYDADKAALEERIGELEAKLIEE